METISIQQYKFSELSEQVQNRMINNYEPNTDHIWDDAEKSVIEFNKLFNLKSGNHSWLDFRNNNEIELTGLRLRTYIINNFELYKPKQFSLWSKIEKSYKHYPNGYPVLKVRKSKLFKDNCCILTGVCYDMDLMQPIYDFLKKPSEITFDDLMSECFDSLKKSIDSEIDSVQSYDYIFNELVEQDLDYTLTGTEI
jgi:hypothetical protein